MFPNGAQRQWTYNSQLFLAGTPHEEVLNTKYRAFINQAEAELLIEPHIHRLVRFKERRLMIRINLRTETLHHPTADAKPLKLRKHPYGA